MSTAATTPQSAALGMPTSHIATAVTTPTPMLIMVLVKRYTEICASVSRALLVPAVFFGINLIEGNLVTPMILGRRMRLNTVALFIGFVFWWYIWGVAGAILAVPMMAALKIMCDHIESLTPIGEFLGT